MSNAAPSAPHSRGLNLLLAITVLLSAWLLFQVQPMVAKRILPWFGGGAAVWTTTMLFFQTALFVGYLYAHLIARALPPRKQILLHCVLLAAAAALVLASGVLPTEEWKPSAADRPAVGILVLLAATVGLPYLALAATAPLVQVWFSRANPSRSPYRLYAISNVGSLAALLSYPLVIESSLGIERQGSTWSLLFVAFAAMCAAAGILSLRRGIVAAEDATSPTPNEPWDSPPRSDKTRRSQAALWVILPACASVLLLAITAYICQNVAPIPLLWILPMVVYLLSFILTFDSDRWYHRGVWLPIFAVTSLWAVYFWHTDLTPAIHWLIPLHLAVLLSGSMICHGELARRRPAPSRLTSYYLCIAGGGAIGGLFTAVIAPMIFVDHYELHLSLLAIWVLALGILLTDPKSRFYDGGKGPAFAGVLVTVALLIAFVISLGAHVVARRSKTVELARSFYGALKVTERHGGAEPAFYELGNGHIAHGGQFLEWTNRRVPMWYFHAQSGIGEVLLKLKATPPRRIGVIGLGPGTLAAYAEKGDLFQFYEINPQVIGIANRTFTYLEDARQRGARIETVEGDARLSLERQPPQDFDVLVLDAFNGDAIPVHLLTLEAIELYLSHLDVDGILAVHISNSYLELDTVVKAAATRYKLDASRMQTPDDMSPGAGAAHWILLHRDARYFAAREFGSPLENEEDPLRSVTWTDDYSNFVEILKW